MLPWWKELTMIPSHKDYKDFAQKVCASFEVPKACNQAKGVDNDHILPPAHPSTRKPHFLPPKNARFGSQDICLTQVQNTISYARALQCWVEEAQSPVPGQPHCLARSTMELQWVMELLVSFMDAEVFLVTLPSNWMEVSSPWLMEPIP